METEEKLTVNWLQQRAAFDNAARNPALLRQTLQLLHNKPSARIVDLGAGTGNNTLYLASHLPEDSRLTVVEQHAYLLQTCQQRCEQAQLRSPLIDFVQQDLHQWLGSTHTVDLVCSSALLDLMTEVELTQVLKRLIQLGTPMYSALTYTGAKFSPTDKADTRFINLFEAHMSRDLDRGRPLGANTVSRLQVLCKTLGLRLYTAPSVWHIDANHQSFMQMNLEFYQRGIEAHITDADERDALSQWLAKKQTTLADEGLSLEVRHQDVLVVP